MIIIETPAPPTRERLVLVPLDTVSREAGAELLTIRTANARDVTPADLERGGYVPLAAFVGPLDLLSPPTLAGALEAIAHLRADLRDAVRERDELRHHYDAASPEHNLLALLDSYESDADTARAQASAAYAMVVAAIGSVGAETIEAAVARLVADRGALVARAEKVERERDEARAELADAKNECAGAMRSAHAQYAETVRQRDTLRGELARLKAPVEGEPTDEEILDAFEVAYRDAASECHANAIRAIYRLGVAHERAMQQPAQDRATDEELYGLFNSTTMAFPVRAGVLAVAARVRQERCLVARAVAANVDVRVCEDNDGGFMVGVHATGCDEELARCVPASDVPATLARLLGEVTRG